MSASNGRYRNKWVGIGLDYANKTSVLFATSKAKHSVINEVSRLVDALNNELEAMPKDSQPTVMESVDRLKILTGAIKVILHRQKMQAYETSRNANRITRKIA